MFSIEILLIQFQYQHLIISDLTILVHVFVPFLLLLLLISFLTLLLLLLLISFSVFLLLYFLLIYLGFLMEILLLFWKIFLLFHHLRLSLFQVLLLFQPSNNL